MKKNRIFRIDFPERNPIYIFTKDSWVGLVPLFNHKDGNHFNNEAKNVDIGGGMITPISYWRLIKEWLHR